MMALDDDRGYQYWAGIHGLPLPMFCDFAHFRPYFLPWHRAYLYFFERALRDRIQDAMLPWWDWRTATGTKGVIPPAYAQRRVDASPNPLFSAKVNKAAIDQGKRQGDTRASRTLRQPGQPQAPPLPSADDIAKLLGRGNFVDFSNHLDQGPHGAVHLWVGGHMSDIAFAAYDPIFWAHHTMVDRIWRLWQLRHGDSSVPRSILNDALPPFQMTVAETLDVTALGYDYAGISRSVATTP